MSLLNLIAKFYQIKQSFEQTNALKSPEKRSNRNMALQTSKVSMH